MAESLIRDDGHKLLMKGPVVEELKARFVTIWQPNKQSPTVQLRLQDNERRWLIVGIALHKILTPALRRFTEQCLKSLYDQLKQGHNIDQRTSKNKLKCLPSSSGKAYQLNYRNINGNDQLTGKLTANYDYSVKSHVDLAKLFLVPYMAHMTGFDESCDSSALIELILQVDCPKYCPQFIEALKHVAADVKDNVRNAWAHCNFTEWDEIKFQDSFQKIGLLISHISLPNQQQVGDELLKWEQEGFAFISSPMVSQDILETLRKDTELLARFVVDSDAYKDTEFQRLEESIHEISNELDNVLQKFRSQLDNHEVRINDIQDCVESHSDTLSTVGIHQKEMGVVLDDLRSQMEQTSTCRKQIEEKITQIEKQNKSITKPNADFGAPFINKWFTGRVDQLKLLCDRYHSKIGTPDMLALCGLGGCGKTSVATEYAYLSKSLYSGGVIWLSAESDQALQNSINKLANEANTFDTKGFRSTLNKTLKWLSRVEEPWLAVVDNMDQAELGDYLRDILFGICRTSGHGHLLVTTRREMTDIAENLAIEANDCVTLGCFTEAESVLFLENRTKQSDAASALSLSNELGHLPLALEQASSYMVATLVTFRDYLTKYRELHIKLLKKAKAQWPKERRQSTQDRLAVQSTWTLNFQLIQENSQEAGLGNACELVSRVSAYLSPDGIPIQIINCGKPLIPDENIAKLFTAFDGTEAKEILSILIRFSLFQSDDVREILSVHRLVQEVIKAQNEESDMHVFYITCALRMLHHAFCNNLTPIDMFNQSDKSSNSDLHTWGFLALSACLLQTHMMPLSRDHDHSIIQNLEAARVIFEASIFHSLNQRHDEALSLLSQKNEILANLPNLKEDVKDIFFCVQIPLFEHQRKAILNRARQVEIPSVTDVSIEAVTHAESYRQLGTEAFQAGRYFDALRLYSEAITAVGSSAKAKLFSNRSLTHLRLNNLQAALDDADRCIDIEPTFWKGHCWRAYALARMYYFGSSRASSSTDPAEPSPAFLYTTGLVAAALAGHYHRPCLVEYKIKVYFPILMYNVISTSEDLERAFLSITERPNTVIVLKPGVYKATLILQRNLRLVGADANVILHGRFAGVKKKKAESIMVHIENIVFPSESGSLVIHENIEISFYRCRFSNGQPGCDDFPYCIGGSGCRNTSNKTCQEQAQEGAVLHGSPVSLEDGSGTLFSGVCGFAGLQVYGGKAIVVRCVFDRCGGGGLLVDGVGSYAKVIDCIVKCNRKMGLEACNGGRLDTINSAIFDNQINGIRLGPNAQMCIIERNVIRNNQQEGVLIISSCAKIIDNRICNNGLLGLSFVGGSVVIKGNKIFENHTWGIMIGSRTSAAVFSNEIFQNKCGGIRIMINFSARVYIDGNTIRHHTGPHLHLEGNCPGLMKGLGKSKTSEVHTKKDTLNFDMFLSQNNEREVYCIAPIISNRNFFVNNNALIQYSKRIPSVLFMHCRFCGIADGQLKKCANCLKVQYCGRICQERDWPSHKDMCKVLKGHNSVLINIGVGGLTPFLNINIFDRSLKGIGQGPPPDKHGGKQFIVKIQSGEYTRYLPNKPLAVYDQSVTLDTYIINAKLYNIILECGILCADKLSSKKIYCWARYEDGGEKLRIYTEHFPPSPEW